MSTFDLLGDIPASHRTLMRLFLRRIRLTAPELDAAIAELPEEKRMTNDELQAAVTALLEQNWLVKQEQEGQVAYTIQQQARR